MTRIIGALAVDLDRLSRELACLIELGALSREETGVLTEYLCALRGLLARREFPDGPDFPAWNLTVEDVTELSGRVGMLAADIDFAYRRLGSAA